MGDDVDPERPAPSPQTPGTSPDPAVVLHPGPPAWALAALLPSAAIALIWFRTAQSGLSSGPDDPVPPLLVAAFTLVAALVLGWRALTQRAVLDDSGLHSRNLTVTYHLDWERIERLDIVHRPGLQIIEVRIHGLRRRHRLGAATRVAGDEAEVVLDAIRAHPIAATLLEDHRS